MDWNDQRWRSDLTHGMRAGGRSNEADERVAIHTFVMCIVLGFIEMYRLAFVGRRQQTRKTGVEKFDEQRGKKIQQQQNFDSMRIEKEKIKSKPTKKQTNNKMHFCCAQCAFNTFTDTKNGWCDRDFVECVYKWCAYMNGSVQLCIIPFAKQINDNLKILFLS